MTTSFDWFGVLGAVALVACSGDTSGPDASVRDASADLAPAPDAPPLDGGGTLPASFSAPYDPGFSATTNDSRSIQVSISSEMLGQQGFSYTPSPSAGDVVFVDGWELHFDEILLTVANVRLNLPGNTPSDQTVVGGLVASRPNALAVDLHRAGPLVGAGGAPETAIPLFALRASDSGGALDPSIRYAFSYDLVAASPLATNVNLPPSEFADYQSMIDRGWTQLYAGTATYRGTPPTSGSTLTDYPTTVRFRLGYGAPAQYLNCFNPDNGSDDSAGVAPSPTGRARAQITVHTDHLFWGALNIEDPPLHFDPFAARATGAATSATVSLDDLVGVSPTNLRDRMNRVVPDRGGQTAGYAPRNPLALSYTLNGASGLRDLRDFVAYSARYSGHFNADGLCAVRPSGDLRF